MTDQSDPAGITSAQPSGPDDLFYAELSSIPPEGEPAEDVILTDEEARSY